MGSQWQWHFDLSDHERSVKVTKILEAIYLVKESS